MKMKKMSAWIIATVLWSKMISFASNEIYFRDIIYNLFILSTKITKIVYWD